ncbi:MAG TPA: hypothetical protein VKB88_32685 [Bryobacteraceae bacterium]|nr:hypothetical protein [Bryobacteraceae bacterium]
MRKLVRESLLNFEKTDQSMRGYEFTVRSNSREFDSHGVKTTRNVVMRREYIDGFAVNHILSRNGVALTPEEYRRHEDDLQKMVAARKAQTPEQRAKQAAERRKRSADQENWFKEAPEALDYHLAGDETIDGRKVIVVAFSPHPGYHASNIWSRVLEKMSGKIWIDPEEGEIARAEAALAGDVTIGWGLVARINQGSRFVLERRRASPRVWLTQKQLASYSARIVFKTIRGESTEEYSEFAPRKEQAAPGP